jgi:hypothetical protein
VPICELSKSDPFARPVLAGSHQWEDFMEYFCLDHPPDRLILCDRSSCERIADCLEVNEQGGESFVCAAHTTSERHVAVGSKQDYSWRARGRKKPEA